MREFIVTLRDQYGFHSKTIKSYTPMGAYYRCTLGAPVSGEGLLEVNIKLKEQEDEPFELEPSKSSEDKGRLQARMALTFGRRIDKSIG